MGIFSLLPNVYAGNVMGENRRRPWSRVQKRVFHRTNTLLTHWLSHGFKVWFLTLTTAVGGDKSKLPARFRELRRRIENMGFENLEHFFVVTDEGNGVIHALLACRTERPGYRRRVFYVKQSKLSRMWFKIHGASVVDVRMVQRDGWTRQYLTNYIARQYIAGQSSILRYGYSWFRSFKFPLMQTWYSFKRWFRGRHPDNPRALYQAWAGFIEGWDMKYNEDGWHFTRAMVEGKWQRWRRYVRANGWQGEKHWTFGRWEIRDFVEPPVALVEGAS